MAKYILESVGNINWMAIGPLILFFIFFVIVTIRAVTIKKAHVEKMGQLPLEEE
jgi:hypothetical protein